MRRTAIPVIACLVALATMAAPARAATNGMLAVAADGKLVTINADGSGPRTLWTAPAPGDITGLAWSPDGNKIAFAYGGKIWVYDLANAKAAQVTVPPAGATDSNPAWRTPDGARIGFRRALANGLQEVDVISADGREIDPNAIPLPGVVALAIRSDLLRLAWVTPLKLLVVSGGGLELASDVVGTPAWSPTDDRLAYVDDQDGMPYDAGLRTTMPDGSENVLVARPPVSSARWAPDGSALVYPAAGEIRIVGAAPPFKLERLPDFPNVTAVDWQPCVAGAFADCVSVAPPTCSALSLTVTTQSDQPVNIPVPECTNPGSRALSYVIVRQPSSGSLNGLSYTPAPGFIGQDEITYRVSNGFGESDLVTVRVFVVKRAGSTPLPTTQPPAVKGAPYLTARTTPRLDRKRRALIKLACDQDCSFSVRLTGALKKPRKTVRSKVLRRSLAAGKVVSVRLRLPTRPKGSLKRVFLTGTVRNAAGDKRSVKLPVRLPR